MARDNGQEKQYLINAVSQKVGLSQKRIREYEKAGFIKPNRAPSTNNRLYKELDIRRIMQVKELIHQHGFTLACLRYFLSIAPCWAIFDCTDKLSCPAYRSPHSPCYLAVKDTHQPLKDDCMGCPVYLNRDVKQIPLLEKA